MYMSLQRFIELVDAYGSDSRRWPESERDAASLFHEQNEQAQQILSEAERLDNGLDAWMVPAFDGLESRLTNQPLPLRRSGVLERLTRWILPQPGQVVSQLWRPALAASLPLMLGLYMGIQLEPDGGLYGADIYTVSSEEDELYLISLSDYAETM
jgi:hypothetical protein